MTEQYIHIRLVGAVTDGMDTRGVDVGATDAAYTETVREVLQARYPRAHVMIDHTGSGTPNLDRTVGGFEDDDAVRDDVDWQCEQVFNRMGDWVVLLDGVI